MPKFLVEATYTAEGHKGLAKDKASGRKTAITQAVKKLGGKLDAIYFCLGENDVILIVDMPDHVSAAALGSAACASGICASGQPMNSAAWNAAFASTSAMGSARPTSSAAWITIRRAMNRGSSPA